MTSSTKEIKQKKTYQGIYGEYQITKSDELEVKMYRFSLLLTGLAFCGGISQWLLTGPSFAWIWLTILALGLGLSLKWIHIYLKPLHRLLQFFWLLGCIGLITITFIYGPKQVLIQIQNNPFLIIAIGPLFAALTGIGFKEFFCFRKAEAIGITLLVPLALIGHLSKIFNGELVLGVLSFSAILFLWMALKKFGGDPSADIGDKSVFEYLQKKEVLVELN